jgi:hypothetical protein
LKRSRTTTSHRGTRYIATLGSKLAMESINKAFLFTKQITLPKLFPILLTITTQLAPNTSQWKRSKVRRYAIDDRCEKFDTRIGGYRSLFSLFSVELLLQESGQILDKNTNGKNGSCRLYIEAGKMSIGTRRSRLNQRPIIRID